MLEQETWTRIIKICIEIASPHLDGTPQPSIEFVRNRLACTFPLSRAQPLLTLPPASGYVLSGVPPNGYVFPTQYGEDGARLGLQSFARPPVEPIMPGMDTLHPELNPQDRQPRPMVELLVANAGPSHTRPTPDPAPEDAIADFLGEPAAGPAEPAINTVIATRDAATAPRRAREADAAYQRLVNREVARRQLQVLKIKKLRDLQARQRLYRAHWTAGRDAAFMAAARKRREVKERKRELDAQRHRSHGEHYVVDVPAPCLSPMWPRVPPLGEAGPGPTTQNARAARQVDARANMAEVYRELVQPVPRPEWYNFTTQSALEALNGDAEWVMRNHQGSISAGVAGALDLMPDVFNPQEIENPGIEVGLIFAPLPPTSARAAETEDVGEDVPATETVVGTEPGSIQPAEPRPRPVVAPAPAPHPARPAPQQLSPADLAHHEAVQRARLQQLSDRGIVVPGHTAAPTSDLAPDPRVGPETAISQAASQHVAQTTTLPGRHVDIVEHGQQSQQVQQPLVRSAPAPGARRARRARVAAPDHDNSQSAPGNTAEPKLYTAEQLWAAQYMCEKGYDVGDAPASGSAAPRRVFMPINDPQTIGLTPGQEALLQSTRPQRGPFVLHLNLADPVYQLPVPQEQGEGLLVSLDQPIPAVAAVEAATVPPPHANERGDMPSRQQNLPHAGPVAQVVAPPVPPMEVQPSVLRRAAPLERPRPPIPHPPLPHSHVLCGAEVRRTGTLPRRGTQDVDMSELFTLPPEILAQGEPVVFAPRVAAAPAHATAPDQASAGQQQQQQVQDMGYGSAPPPPPPPPPHESSMAVPQAPPEPQLQPLSDEEFAMLAALAMQIEYDDVQYGPQYDPQYEQFPAQPAAPFHPQPQPQTQPQPTEAQLDTERRAATLEGEVKLAERQAQRQKREARRAAERDARVARGEPPSPPKRVYKRKNAHQRTASVASQVAQDQHQHQDGDRAQEQVSAVHAQEVQQQQALDQQARIYAAQAARMREVSLMMGAVPHSDQGQHQYKHQHQHQLQPPPELTQEVVPNYGEVVHQEYPAAMPQPDVLLYTAQQNANQLQDTTFVPPHPVQHQDWQQGTVQQDPSYYSQQAFQQQQQQQQHISDIQLHPQAGAQHGTNTHQAAQPANWWIKQEMVAPQGHTGTPMNGIGPVDQFPSAVQMEREFAAYQESDYRQRLALDEATAYLGAQVNVAQPQHTSLLPLQQPYRPFDVSMPDPSTLFHSPFSADTTAMAGWSEPMWDPQQASLSAPLVADAASPYVGTPASAGWAAPQSAFMSPATQGTPTWFDMPPSAPAGTPHFPTPPPPVIAISEPASQHPTPLSYMPTPVPFALDFVPTPQMAMSSHDSSTQPTPVIVTPAPLPPMFTREDMERAMGVSPSMLTPSPMGSPFPPTVDEYRASQGAASGSGSDTLAPPPNIGGGSRKRTLSEYTASPAADEGVEAAAPAPPAKKRRPYTKKGDKVDAEPKAKPKPKPKPKTMPRPKKTVEYTNGPQLAAFHARNAIQASTQSQSQGRSGVSGVAGVAGVAGPNLPVASLHPSAATTTANHGHAHAPGQPSPRLPLNQKQPNATQASAHSHLT